MLNQKGSQCLAEFILFSTPLVSGRVVLGWLLPDETIVRGLEMSMVCK